MAFDDCLLYEKTIVIEHVKASTGTSLTVAFIAARFIITNVRGTGLCFLSYSRF